ncbi:hypothetical protein ANCDUO_04299 [Ancylostoma duodenale]|uniref:Uncharacterized protein n=1 Tax=Ancylostoma duodenale TaxID=51022 RepID=A0A0C2D6Y6_9BILA|nr:hypothetical protein ANCDUO_04299 [Ancylostoma duodenale]
MSLLDLRCAATTQGTIITQGVGVARSDQDDSNKQEIVEGRLKAYPQKKPFKPGPIIKCSVILDVKP